MVDAVAENRTAWNRVYEKSPRLRYPDLMFVHFLMRYAWPRGGIRSAVCIGEGDGPQALAIARLGVHVTCVDLSEVAVARLEQFARDDGLGEQVEVQVGDQRRLEGLPDNGFDLALSWSVISYGMPGDGVRAVREIHRVLRPGGSFIGLLESTTHTGFSQPGVEPLGPRTYRMPPQPRQSKPGVVMTYYGRQDVAGLLEGFDELALSHRIIELPPDLGCQVGQWMFHCVKAPQ